MAEESKPIDPKLTEAEETSKGKGKAAAVESDDEFDEDVADEPAAATGAKSTGGKKKKSKRKKIKDALSGKLSSSQDDKEAQLHKAIDGLTPDQVSQLLELNPALAGEIAKAGGSNDIKSATEALKQLKLQEIMTGLAASGKNAKDMGAYKFWATQPVVKFGEDTGERAKIEDGPIRVQTVDQVAKEPAALLAGFEWCTMDLVKPEELKEVEELLHGHYVEDDEAMFRFNYSASILKWAMMPPGWKKEWHIGIRASQSRKLVAFISAVPIEMRVRESTLHASEVNFLCIHKKLRSKRLAPVLIKEVTRRCNLEQVWQAIYTGGIVLPTPVSTCRYFHRAIDWQKLWETGFSPLPAGSKPQYQVRKYALPDKTTLKGLREMQEKDVDAVHDLLTRYLRRYELAPDFTKEDIVHWLVHNKKKDQLEEQVMWSFVVEDENKRITDFFSFYCLESSVIRESKHKVIRAAYLFYYATETGLTEPVDQRALKSRLNTLMSDGLILSKKHRFDVFNALSLMDNGLFLDELKFGSGDGQLHYYLFNYRANAIAGGVDKRNRLDDSLSGVGFVML
ncbi:acyl-CoA N-acyltransferase [Xylariales sp. AK1849]|nr:acyl-CoA N-acyltransferase [Xylariales sp. AK1849]